MDFTCCTKSLLQRGKKEQNKVSETSVKNERTHKKMLSEELTKAMDWFRFIKYSIHFAAWYTMVF